MLALLADIGSTFTKVTVVDLGREEVAATAQAPTTVADINRGIVEATRRIEERMSVPADRIACRMACSSAAGGLRMVTVGLIPDLTVEAAKRAALGAGAKVVGVFSHQLTISDLDEMAALRPDIVLLCGGTNGGNEQVILHNAQAIARSDVRVPIVVAGNRVAADRVRATLESSGREVWVTENVMPEVGELNVAPAQMTIREIFLRRIIVAKGLDKVQETFGIVMPTPSAVLRAAELLAQGAPGEPGLGDLVVVDVGGATTDVHSIGEGRPTKPGVVWKGLPEPFAKRTVEGDLGIRYNAPTILQMAGRDRLSVALGHSELALDWESIVQHLCADADHVPQDAREMLVDVALARVAVEIAVDRHVGNLTSVYTPFGEMLVQRGKDLTTVGHLVGTGGIFAYSDMPRRVLEGALFDPRRPTSLRPIGPEMHVDRRYIMAAVGLLAEKEPTIALRVLKKSLSPA